MLFLFGLVGKNDDFVTAHLHITAFNGKFLEGAAFVFLDANNACLLYTSDAADE